MFIVTERLFLRPLWQEDADSVQQLINDWDIVSKLARAPWPYTLADARAFTAHAEKAADAGQEILLAICLRPANQLMGLAGVARHDTGAWELGYWLGKSYWGHGFASEAAAAVVAAMFESYRVPLLVAGHHLDNPASGTLLGKLGFSPSHVEDQFCLAQKRDVPVQCLQLARTHWLQRRAVQAF